MNDRQKLDQIHGMFRNLNKKPFVKTCFAYIGNPYDETVPNSVRAKFYPITYNKFIHCAIRCLPIDIALSIFS